ncbi:4-hydroxy-tetrahydrodipicolinate synthase [Paratissierella segnis]|jgi:4-hydroxy-tetrahydrodipicolinate synthase|uniref:4-hydroxy-tetrahydrodipicolinate synthase n=1 Tax=Paratissierella segnis TaxID=2763679 RepID=A0A926IKL6_9FIRM|nr:4-hydroxy-tetrahydrodipicolinate synthase [Paratissierella segnis]MBC8589199.1 4-hydroxy-tetrahydrodipicolinate synthase [Paratissierella segnis]
MINWGRLITAMVTPFDDKLNVDYDKVVSLAKKLTNEGNTALVLTGTTGEAPTLTSEEKANIYKIVKENVGVPIIAGVGTNSTKATIENAKAAKEIGVDGLLIVTPYYNKPDQDSLYCHFKAIAEETDLPIMLYNVPGRTGCNMLPETVEKLAEIENIVALKEAGGNIVQFAEIIKRVPDDFLIYSGDDSMTLPAMAVGAYGVVSVASHIVGPEMKEMIDAFVVKDTERAKDIHLKLLDVFKDLFIVANPIPVKAALNMTGIDVGGVRLPLTGAREKVLKVLRKDLEELGKL